MHKPRVFLDSSVLIAALLSSRGGSHYVLTQFSDRVSFQINEYVSEELRRIFETKLKDRHGVPANLFLLLGLAGVSSVSNPHERDVRYAEKIISSNDAPILATALAHSDFLLTLDNEFFKPAVVALAEKHDLAVLKPGDLIRMFDTRDDEKPDLFIRKK